MGSLIAQIIRSRWMPLLFLAGVLALAATPADAGSHRLSLTQLVPLCLFKQLTGLPCPGCGMTRSLIHLAHGDVCVALALNPVGLLLFPALAALALAALVPLRLREPAARWIESRSPWFNIAGICLGIAMLLNGAGRILWIVWGRHPSSW